MKMLRAYFCCWTILRLIKLCLIMLCLSQKLMAGELPNPYPVKTIPIGAPIAWRFPDDAKSWKAVRDCKLQLGRDEGFTTIQSTGTDSILVRSVPELADQFEVEVTCRSGTATTSQLFWDSSGRDRFTESKSQRFEILGDGQWHNYRVRVPERGIRSLRWDPLDSRGSLDVQTIQIQPYRRAPFEIIQVNWSNSEQLTVFLRANVEQPVGIEVTAKISGSADSSPIARSTITVDSNSVAKVELRVPLTTNAADLVEVLARSSEFHTSRPSVRSNVVQRLTNGMDWNEVVQGWLELIEPQRGLWVAPDGSSALIGRRTGEKEPWKLAAYIAPLSWDRNSIETLRVDVAGDRLICSSENSKLQMYWSKHGLHLSRNSRLSMEGPVVRVAGRIEQGLLAGVEHLGGGERSSSDLDIQTEDRFRFEPPPHHLTMQLAALVTGADRVALSWQSPHCQPAFATPNFYDGFGDSRMSLMGRDVDAIVSIGDGWNLGGRLENCLLDYVALRGLPPISMPARTVPEQDELNKAGLESSDLRAKQGGWYHAILPGSHGMPDKPHWFGDHASAWLALGQPLPVAGGQLVRGGSHIANDRWMLLHGRATDWLAAQKQMLAAVLSRQQSDGSAVYDGQWAIGHFEKTSSGQCGLLAEQLMNIALLTSDQSALEAGLKSLEYCKKFRTPRGAQVWECPLHAPDIMAAAHLTRAYTIAYRLTGNEEYRQLAARWAISGLPFIYQWGETSAMPYSTIATLCATHRVAPLWIGRPVQWCGIVYADALLDLAAIDQTLDWKRLAQGIYVSTTHQQYVEGPSIGLLPDSIAPMSTRRFPLDINPATIVLLGHRLQGRNVQNFCELIDGKHIVSPWPMRIADQHIGFDSPKDSGFQILINGQIHAADSSTLLNRPVP